MAVRLGDAHRPRPDIMVDAVLSQSLPGPLVLLAAGGADRDAAVVAREAGIDADQDHGHIGQLMADGQRDHRSHVAERRRAHLDALGLVAAVAGDEVEHLAARRFDPADRLACLDAARHALGQIAVRHVVQHLTDQAIALQQFLEPHDETRFQVAGRFDHGLDREVRVGAIGRFDADVARDAGCTRGRPQRAQRCGLRPGHRCRCRACAAGRWRRW